MKKVAIAVVVSQDELLEWLHQGEMLPPGEWVVTDAVDNLCDSGGYVRLELVLSPEEDPTP